MPRKPAQRHDSLKFSRRSPDAMLRRARAFYNLMDRRRSVRFFSDDKVPRACIEQAVLTAGTAPSGANMQPWTWVVVDRPSVKREIRLAAEEEERRNYLGGRMSPEWRAALFPLGTEWRKPFLETAPFLVICFAQAYGLGPDGQRIRHYYVQESVGIACGVFIAAIHGMGLVTLTHTPSPMNFITRILKRPANERAYLLFPVGFPARDATVPRLKRKPVRSMLKWNR